MGGGASKKQDKKDTKKDDKTKAKPESTPSDNKVKTGKDGGAKCLSRASYGEFYAYFMHIFMAQSQESI